MQSQNRQLAAILFTDIVGYTALMQKDEEKAVVLIMRYTAVLQKMVAIYEGTVLNDYGDGSLCTFTSALQCVKCAIAIQQELQTGATVPLRIGLHTGELFFENGKVLGDGVNVASRIQSLGQANTILFSKDIFDKIKNHPEFNCISLGRFEFKNVDESLEVFALASGGMHVPKRESMEGKLKERKNTAKNFSIKLWIPGIFIGLLALTVYFFLPDIFHKIHSGTKEMSIAVLPFKNISSNEKENESFCSGVALELHKKLQWIGGLLPIDPQSVEKFRDTKMSVSDISTELGNIKYILQGTVQRDKNKVMVFASLVDAETGREIWSNNFPGEMEDVFSLQENIAQKIAEELKIKVTPAENNRIARVPTKNIEALDKYNEAVNQYLKLESAVHPLYWDSLQSNPQLYEKYQTVLALCNQVIGLDSLMAEVYVLKAKTYFYRYNYGDHKNFLLDSIYKLSNKALSIDGSSTEALVLQSNYYGLINQPDKELEILQKAILITENNFDVNRALVSYFSFKDAAQAIRYAKKAIRLNPLSSYLPDVFLNLGLTYHQICDFEKAEYNFKKALAFSGTSPTTIKIIHEICNLYLHWGKADSVFKYSDEYLKFDVNGFYTQAEALCNLTHDYALSSQLYEKLWGRYHNHVNLHRWAVPLFKLGKVNQAKALLDSGFAQYIRAGNLGYDLAGMYSLKGDNVHAMELLKKFDWGWGSPYLIQHDLLFEKLWGNQEYKELLKKVLDQKTEMKNKIRKMEESGNL